jgi:glycosyltransferase involved in cell wall biosynthesis
MSEPALDVVFVVLDKHITVDNSPVLQTQVGGQILAVHALGLRPALVCTVEDARRFREVIGDRFAASGITVCTIDHRGLAANLAGVVAVLRRLRSRVRAAYARSIWGALAIRIASFDRMQYVYDVRGALAEETISKGSADWKARVFSFLERVSVRRARHVSAVSTGLAAQVAARYAVTNVAVLPSCVDVEPLRVDAESRARIRAVLGFPPDAIVLVYSGGLNYYQQVPEMLALWHSVLDDPRLHYLLLTNETPHVGERGFDIARFDSRLVHRTVPHAQVHELLANSDIGFLMRAQEPLNAVASPVKAAEYLMAGLAVAISPGIGDASSLIESADAGAIIPSQREEATAALRALVRKVDMDRDRIRQRSRQAALSRYAWTAYGPVFSRFYGSAAK